MRQLLILLFILLLSPPLLCQETGVLYQWETSSECVWKSFGDDNLHAKYVGEIKNGEPDGLGVMYNAYPSFHVESLEVCYIFVDPKPPTLFGENYFKGKYSSIFEGEWKNGKIEGRGKYTFKSGDTLSGFFKNGEEWNTRRRDKKGKVIAKIKNGEIVCSHISFPSDKKPLCY